jgi:hypothetical protein
MKRRGFLLATFVSLAVVLVSQNLFKKGKVKNWNFMQQILSFTERNSFFATEMKNNQGGASISIK